MAGETLANIVMLETYFGRLPRKFSYNGKTHAIKDQIRSWTVTGKVNYCRFSVVLDTGEQANVYKFIGASGDSWKLDVTTRRWRRKMTTYYCTECSAKTEASIVNLHGTPHDGCVLAGTWFTEPSLTAEETLKAEMDDLKAALRKCLPSRPHMNCSAERWAADEHIAVVLHRREWEQIAELALTPDELKEYILYPRERKGDPNCEQCHGAGCAQCSDDIYYAQQEVAEQVRRDAELDFSRRIAD